MRDSAIPPTSVDLVIDGSVATVTLQGQRGIQILSARTRSRLREVLDELETRTDLRIVCFQGTSSTFVAGADVHEFLDLKPEAARKLAREGQQLMTRIASLPQITLAGINGACVGGGLELALACDLRLAVRKAKIGFPEVSLGLLPCWGGTVRTTQLFGSALACRLILTGELITARAAEKLGLIHATAPAEEWESLLNEWTALLLKRGPHAQSLARKIIRRNASSISQLELGLAEEVAAFVACVESGQVQQGVEAFLRKEEANWRQSF